MKGLVIAGTHSGCGKTTVTLALMAALVKRGLHVAPFKVGPDFIDPGHHTRITQRVSRNLDGWILTAAYNRELFNRQSKNADVAVVEGVMGLFDGYDGRSEAGSTAQMAKWLGLPVLLVVDARSMARSAAALVQGFERFDPQLAFCGVLFNRIGGARHMQFLKEALADHVKMPCIGAIPRNNEVTIPERHLGLVTRQDHPLEPESIQSLAQLIEENIALDRFLESLPELKLPDPREEPAPAVSGRPVRIGLARDNAFCFYYQENIELLERAGAKIIPFSPITNTVLPPDIDGLYFGGGYPELFAERLSANTALKAEIREKQEGGLPIYAECGGFMYLCNELCDMQSKTHPMVGIFPFSARMDKRLRALGYREISLIKDTLLGKTGTRIRGHEFHYSQIEHKKGDVETIYQVGPYNHSEPHREGYINNRCLGSYIHLHFGSCPEAAFHFVQACRAYKNK